MSSLAVKSYVPCFWRQSFSFRKRSEPWSWVTSHHRHSSGHGVEEGLTRPKRKLARSPGAKTSLRRVAVEAERTRDRTDAWESGHSLSGHEPKTVTAYCAAEQYRSHKVSRILKDVGYTLDPHSSGLYPQVVHVQAPSANSGDSPSHKPGDVFIFPSGTAVAWNVEEEAVLSLISKGLLPAAVNPHNEKLESEDLDYFEDPLSDKSGIVGDRIKLGTRALTPQSDTSGSSAVPLLSSSAVPEQRKVNLTLAKIAFSSGLARSAKLAVLETALDDYFESTRSIPTLLSQGSRLPFTRPFILRKTGELLNLRAQLNLYSELTDSLPDLFWDSRHELGLEGYFDQVGKALDVGVRIRILNQRMDYAQEIAAVMRERLSEKHGLFLEWLIITLIAIEVGFEIIRMWRESNEKKNPDSLEFLLRRYLEESRG